MAFERLFSESSKTFFRIEKQDKYNIPQKLHFFGKTVENQIVRTFIEILYVAFALFLLYLPKIMGLNLGPHVINGLFWGALAGLIGSALGGCMKDAPIEGFQLLKFFRSPIIGAIWGIIFSFFTNNYSILLFAGIGGERMTIKFYKTLMTTQTPGKFQENKVTRPEWLIKRKAIIIPYVITWIVFFSLLVLA